MSAVFAIGNLAFLIFLFYILSKQKTSLETIYWPTLLLKLLAGIALGIVYTYYYSIADTFGFFEDGTKMASYAREDFMGYIKLLWRGNESYLFLSHLNFTQPRALFLSKIVSVFCLITNNNYWIISLYFSFVSFACSWKLVNILVKHFPHLKVEAAIGFLFVPSVVFWGSGLIKECVAIGSLFFITSVFLKVWFKEKIQLWEVTIGVIALWFLWQLKYYYAGIFLPIVVTTLLVKWLFVPALNVKSGTLEILLWVLVIILPFIGISLLKENFHPDIVLGVVVKNYKEFQILSEQGDAIIFDNLKPTVQSILFNSPKALFSGFFRPFIWETHNVLQLLFAFENLLLLLLFIFSIKNWKDAFSTPYRLLIVSIIAYVTLLCIFLTLSTPNFGTLSRYRIGFLPFLVFLLSIKNPVVHFLYKFIQRLYFRIVR